MTTGTSDPPVAKLAPSKRSESFSIAKCPNKAILRAARVAGFNGWATGIVAALSAPFAFFSVMGALIFVSLMVVAYNEFRGRRRLLQLDPRAATLLGWNQLGLLALVTAYCGWMIFTGLATPNPLANALAANPDLGAILGSTDQIEALYREVVVSFYGIVFVLSVVFQGLNAAYYFTRRKLVEQHVREEPSPTVNRRPTTAFGER